MTKVAEAKVLSAHIELIGQTEVLTANTTFGRMTTMDNNLINMFKHERLIGANIVVEVDAGTTEMEYNCIHSNGTHKVK